MSELEPTVEAVVETPLAAPETAAPASGDISEEPSTSASPDAELSAIYRKLNPDRDSDGRFTSTKVPEEEQTAPETPLEGDKVPDQEPEIPVPQSWSAEARALWEKVPPEARPIIAKREAEAHKTITEQGQRLKAYEPVQEIVEQNRATFERYGIDAKTGITQLINANNYLERDPVNAIRDLAKAYGVDLNRYSNAGQNGQPDSASPDSAALRAELADLRRQMQSTDHRLVSREQQDAERQMQTIENQVADFAKDKPDFAELADDVEEQILALKAKNPHLDPREALQKAYERARKINPASAARLDAEAKQREEAARIEAQKKRAAEAKKAAPLNVASSPANSSTPRSVDDTLREVARKAFRR